ncbi:MAG: hypothetical protein KBE41_04730 [Lutibacter sp.]|nr:hypothetical protein [Lutibacter sp.]MBP9600789.1 hypothetical protein [Lutibacter sp.]
MAFSFSDLFKKNTTTTEINVPKIDFKGGTKFAENETDDVYLDVEVLGGFPFVKTIIIGAISVKIKRVGCSLTFFFENNETLTIHSDNTAIESNRIKNTPFNFTEIDFELNNGDASKIKNKKIDKIVYNLKDTDYTFNTI